MKIAVFQNNKRLAPFLERLAADHRIDHYRSPLSPELELESTDYRAAVITPHSIIGRTVLDRLPRLEYLVSMSIGHDHIDLAACRAAGVTVSPCPGYSASAVAEYTFALLLALARKLPAALALTGAGRFTPRGLQGFELGGKTIGLIGAGAIGRRTATIARGFGMTVLAHAPHRDREAARQFGFEYTPLEDLLARSDVISLHAPYTPENRHLLNDRTLALVKPGAVVVNTARGGLIDSAALVRALEAGTIAGAALDVIEEIELIDLEDGVRGRSLDGPVAALIARNDVVVSPHAAWFTGEAFDRGFQMVADSLAAFIKGKPINVVA